MWYKQIFRRQVQEWHSSGILSPSPSLPPPPSQALLLPLPLFPPPPLSLSLSPPSQSKPSTGARGAAEPTRSRTIFMTVGDFWSFKSIKLMCVCVCVCVAHDGAAIRRRRPSQRDGPAAAGVPVRLQRPGGHLGGGGGGLGCPSL